MHEHLNSVGLAYPNEPVPIPEIRFKGWWNAWVGKVMGQTRRPLLRVWKDKFEPIEDEM